MLTISAFSVAAFVSVVSGCTSSEKTASERVSVPVDKPVTLNATVRDRQEVGAGCWQLDTSQGRYQPIDLPKKFLVDRLKVRVRLRATDPEMVSICMFGQLVHVESVTRGWQ